MKRRSGFTLLELVVSTSLASILFCIAIPALSNFLNKQKIDSQTYSIWRMLNKTRALAINSGRKMTLCGMDENNQCARDNIQTFVIFYDANKNYKLDASDTTYEHLQLNQGSTIHLRTSLSRKVISYRHNGYVVQNAGITICPLQDDPTLIKKVSVNRAGRSYLDPDRDGDGRIETSKGDLVKCEY